MKYICEKIGLGIHGFMDKFIGGKKEEMIFNGNSEEDTMLEKDWYLSDEAILGKDAYYCIKCNGDTTMIVFGPEIEAQKIARVMTRNDQQNRFEASEIHKNNIRPIPGLIRSTKTQLRYFSALGLGE